MLCILASNSLKMVAIKQHYLGVKDYTLKEEQHIILLLSNPDSSSFQWEVPSRAIYKRVIQNFACQNCSASIVSTVLQSIWLRATKFCTRMSFYANYLVNASVCFKIRHINGQTVLSLPVVADGRMRNVWSLPDRCLGRHGTKDADDHYFLPTPSFPGHTFHIQIQ